LKILETEKGSSKDEEISYKISEATEIHDVNKNFCGNRLGSTFMRCHRRHLETPLNLNKKGDF